MRPSYFCCTLLVLILCGTGHIVAQNDQPPVDEGTQTNLLVRSADARLRLAQADLEIALERNRQVPGNVSDMDLKRLKANIRVARQQLAVTRQISHGSAYPNQLVAAKSAAEMAHQEYHSALKANKDLPGTIPMPLINRMKIKAELANIRVELWKDPGDYIPSMMHEMQWQIDRLTEQVIELSERVEAQEKK